MRLNKELKVAVEIYRLNEAGAIPYYTNLKEVTNLPSTEIHLALDNLIDMGAIDAEWAKTGGMWVRKFTINHISRDFVREISEYIENGGTIDL